MLNDNLKIRFQTLHRQARCAPDPAYPEGIDVDNTEGQLPSCYTKLPYPAECCGIFLVTCEVCHKRYAITTAGRPDDPRSLRILCETRR